MAEPPITPVPIPAGVRDAIVFGGTFDPPHVGHITPALQARELAGLGGARLEGAGLEGAWLLYVPAARSPHKAHNPIASDADRVAMLRLALEGVDRAAVWTDEVDRASGEPTYTVDTLRRLHAARPELSLRLLIGADQAQALHRWREPREIVKLAPPLLMLRGGVSAARADLAQRLDEVPAWSPEERAGLLRSIVEVEPVEASATRARELLRSPPADAKADAELGGILNASVRRFVESHKLYKT
ncbi:MAG: adenylyltransferase/cytidyltransferase family protein [Phycisphaerales bacterium]|nr:adenylyltransferase/cytidyltransferase family protein [Phycisphaerales bacterium]